MSPLRRDLLPKHFMDQTGHCYNMTMVQPNEVPRDPVLQHPAPLVIDLSYTPHTPLPYCRTGSSNGLSESKYYLEMAKELCLNNAILASAHCGPAE